MYRVPYQVHVRVQLHLFNFLETVCVCLFEIQLRHSSICTLMYVCTEYCTLITQNYNITTNTNPKQTHTRHTPLMRLRLSTCVYMPLYVHNLLRITTRVWTNVGNLDLMNRSFHFHFHVHHSHFHSHGSLVDSPALPVQQFQPNYFCTPQHWSST